MARVDQRRITLKVGEIDLGIARTKSGGGLASETTKDRPGGMQDEVDYGGPAPTVEDVELGFVFDLDQIQPKVAAVRAQAGVPKAAVITEQYLDRDKNAKGKPNVYVGSVTAVSDPDYDANSTDEVATLSVTVSVTSPIG